MKTLKKIIAGITVFSMLSATLLLQNVDKHEFDFGFAMNAADNAVTVSAPSVTAFATKAQLVDNNNFSLYKESDESTGVAQKVNFGTKEDESAQMWYIAGSNNSGNELVLMCDPTSPFTQMIYEKNWQKNKIFESSLDWGDYGDNALKDGDVVSSNHYGASQLRAYLTGDALNVFNNKEKDLIINTPVYTDDLENKVNYCTSDKLYAGYGFYADKYFTIGRNADDDINNGIKVALSNDAATNGSPFAVMKKNMFWLRAPYYPNFFALVATTYHCLINYITVNELSVTPALNMDISSVLFASTASATTDSSSITDSMTFRFADNESIKSTASFTKDEINITKNDDENKVYLYVQYMNGSSDEIYSKEITSSESVTIPDVNLTNAKVWLETENTEDKLVYAKMATTDIVPIEPTEPTEPTTEVVVGDANEDGTLNIRDAATIARMLAQGKGDEIPMSADYNGDGKVNIRDAAAIARYLANKFS